jgi:type I restriction-modification system DNA methylase subunit
MNQIEKDIKKLAKLDVDKYVRKMAGAAEENVKIKIVIPLLNLLGYSTEEDMDFEHHVQNKKADIALLTDGKPKLPVETKDLDQELDNHVNQGLDYAFNKGVEWVVLSNGIETRVYKSFIPGISNPKDRLLFVTTLEQLPLSFNRFLELVGKEHLYEAKRLNEKAESIRENITAKILIDDLAECREKLFADLLSQFKARYQVDVKFKETIDTWATVVKMNISDPKMISKLCREGAYTLINRVLFLRICEDRGYIKSKLSKNAIVKWREMVEKPTSLLKMAFDEIGESFEGLYKSPLFDSINCEDIDWNIATINFVLDRLGEQDFSKISKDILGRAYEQHISDEERKELGQFYTPDFIIDYILDRMNISAEKTILDPSCGSGGFLIRAYDRLRNQYVTDGWAEDKIHKEILKRNLFGIDINPFATQLTVMNLLLKDLNHPTGEINVVEGDTLEKLEEKFDLELYKVDSPLAYISKTGEKLTYALLLKHMPFNVVIGNPPYVSFGLRGVSKIADGQYKYLKSNYPNSAEYKISMYAVFMERALQLLAQDGRFGFVIPDSFLLGRYFSKLRKYILDNCKIVEIVLFSKDFWKYGVVGRPVVIILEKGGGQEF